jgi:phosphoribosylformimino-5-aminoimidazole carboxamide ribonucleotide (ProFAR) isomerase
VSGAADLRLLAGVRSAGRGLVGAIVGKAIYEGALTVAEAVAACESMPAGS